MIDPWRVLSIYNDALLRVQGSDTSKRELISRQCGQAYIGDELAKFRVGVQPAKLRRAFQIGEPVVVLSASQLQKFHGVVALM